MFFPLEHTENKTVQIWADSPLRNRRRVQVNIV